ncbi:hypothetical protein JAAARDRAFT_119663 [Jaapia argillacea MUCL 33604]|uniref:Ig-like domain-containing protein n=1 Tax=Jaapia argillacea MUCL 33604 TaxID=933084 RepID=A0A067QKR0_9AGAM|nr:hypothetical protein JAAARDRAFT_119663 [Jaapia argillacea MUCL 33604]
MSGAKPPPPPTPQPFIPEKYLDIPSQRLYYLSLGLLCQAIKLFDFVQYLFTSDEAASFSYSAKWLSVDLAYLAILSRLRIPRLNYSKAVVILQIASFWFMDGILFGGISLNLAGVRTRSILPSSLLASEGRQDVVATPSPFYFSDLITMISLGLISSTADYDAHLLGQHTVRMSPISTAHLNPDGQTYCLSTPGTSVLIPILLNNTSPSSVQYSLTPLGYTDDVDGDREKGKGGGRGKVEFLELSGKELRAIENARLEELKLTRAYPGAKHEVDDEDYDEYDHEDQDSTSGSALQKTQSLIHIKLSKPGTLRLLHVYDSSNVEARIPYPSDVTVVPCPRAEFVEDPVVQGDNVRCAGDHQDLNFEINIFGVPPMSLKWYKEINGKREYFMVEGIEGNHEEHHPNPDDNADMAESGHQWKRRGGKNVPQELKVPLSVTLDALGSHAYVLETVTDGVGNVIRAGTLPSSNLNNVLRKAGVIAGSGSLSDVDATTTSVVNSRTTRSLTVLRRPTVSFRDCGPGKPAKLLIGSEAPLLISTKDADSLDAPWDVSIKYQPPLDVDEATKNKRYRPWTRSLETQKDKKDLTLRANAPGEYTIMGVKGKYCDGDVLNPETCKVIEMPLPRADIEWKRIHECSGDTGVSASLVIHGTPPFQVYYRTQRDNEPARELVKTFQTSRGEITLQPERSGHYVYTFLQLSDANYKKVDLKGPSIDQIVHPLASADFAQTGTAGRGKKMISSCSGSTVPVDVEFRGNGPWNLEVQIVSPTTSEFIKFPEIVTTRKTLEIPIPKAIDKEGGSFEIDLVSVEDNSGCKRSITVPGISVNVRRVKPTAKFYGKDGKRNITVLEHEPAKLPLRLTGDGPWRIRYGLVGDPESTQRVTVTNPNDQLSVTTKGVYEILQVSDSQCPGSVIADEATYRVDWIPRPHAQLTLDIQATFESYNGSYILPPICEGTDDHADLELTGTFQSSLCRPPFQIMYNVARDNDAGGMKLLDQPTFSSIQHRTRFQLHTADAGRMYYEVKQIGDAAYPLAKHKNSIIPRSERLLFEQEVMMRPSAQFRNRNRITFCLGDTLVPRDPMSSDGLIMLEGKPPFQLRLSVKNLAASEVHTEAIEVPGRSWKMELPSYTFKSIGPHLVTIESVQDSSHCTQAIPDPLSRSIWVDVAETAAIIPFDRRDYFCLGETSRFSLEGTPPWTIGYRVHSKSYSQEAKVSPFSIVQQQPGEFVVTSIAHQNQMCKTAVTDLRYAVHSLPSAQVGHGKRVFQDIHEGDQAEIVFTLVGEPPFTFTYQRAEPSTRKGGKPGRVLETHTVSGVTTNEYSIYSALEGTWTVTFISDRYCRYPPAQADAGSEKATR